LVIWPVKIVPEMIYYVSSGTLNPTHSPPWQQNEDQISSSSFYLLWPAPETRTLCNTVSNRKPRHEAMHKRNCNVIFGNLKMTKKCRHKCQCTIKASQVRKVRTASTDVQFTPASVMIRAHAVLSCQLHVILYNERERMEMMKFRFVGNDLMCFFRKVSTFIHKSVRIKLAMFSSAGW